MKRLLPHFTLEDLKSSAYNHISRVQQKSRVPINTFITIPVVYDKQKCCSKVLPPR